MTRPALAILRVALTLVPLALTPVFAYLLSHGDINLGGGEKDVIVLIPWLLWSLVFAVSSWLLWWRGHDLWASTRRSALAGLAGLAIAILALVAYGTLRMVL
jgi:hypothetical protein